MSNSSNRTYLTLHSSRSMRLETRLTVYFRTELALILLVESQARQHRMNSIKMPQLRLVQQLGEVQSTKVILGVLVPPLKPYIATRIRVLRQVLRVD